MELDMKIGKRQVVIDTVNEVNKIFKGLKKSLKPYKVDVNRHQPYISYTSNTKNLLKSHLVMLQKSY